MAPGSAPLGDDRSASAGDPRFFLRAGPYTLAAVVDAAAVDGHGAEAPPRRLMLHGIAPLAIATGHEVTFCLNNRKYLPVLAATQAAAVIVHPDMQDKVPRTAVAIVAADPLVAWAKVAALFHPPLPGHPRGPSLRGRRRRRRASIRPPRSGRSR